MALPEPAGTLSIGDVAEQTGVLVATLRVWESRHGFPVPHRLGSGHRRYDPSDVATIHEVLRLRRSGVRLDAAIARAQRNAEASVPEARSVFAELRRHHPELPVHRLTKATLLGLSRALEDELASRNELAMLFGGFQRREFYAASRSRWQELARVARSAYVFADFEQHATDARLVTVPLDEDAPMRQEWLVVADGPGLSVAMAAWELPGQEHAADGARVFESIWTLEPTAVRDCARVCGRVAAAEDGSDGAALLDELAAEPETESIDPIGATALFHRVLTYVDRVRST